MNEIVNHIQSEKPKPPRENEFEEMLTGLKDKYSVC